VGVVTRYEVIFATCRMITEVFPDWFICIGEINGSLASLMGKNYVPCFSFTRHNRHQGVPGES
jgi:hypothetical protein